MFVAFKSDHLHNGLAGKLTSSFDRIFLFAHVQVLPETGRIDLSNPERIPLKHSASCCVLVHPVGVATTTTDGRTYP